MTDLPNTMNAFVLTGYGGFECLVYQEEWPTPVPAAGEVIVKVGACGLNNTDVNTRTGWYAKSVTSATTGDGSDVPDAGSGWGGSSIQFPRIQGADVCGTIVVLGGGVDPNLMGKRVMVETWLRDADDSMDMSKAKYFGSEVDGGFAQYTKAAERQVFPIESDLSDAEIATFATSYVTAENMLNRADVREGDTVLVPGASGGVGSALIQLANRRGAECIALSGDDKAAAIEEIGVRAVLPRSPENLSEALMNATGSDKVSVVADAVGGPLFPQMIDVLSRGGRYTCAGAIAGPIVDLDLRTMYLNDLTFTGATVVPPGTFGDLVGYIERGEIQPILAATYPLTELHAAQQAFIDKKHVGNIVVTP